MACAAWILVLISLACGTQNAEVAKAASGSVPVIYTTDLYHPHDDPDDHFDLATLFALPEFDIRAVIFDLGPRGKDRPGLPALRQLMHITGREVPHALGLTDVLRSPEDRAENQPAEAQAGIDLILSVLRESREPATIITAGSLRDVAAAFNREPALFREKVARLYINIGHSGGGEEHNVRLDPHAYVRILRSGLPVHWVPCFGADGYYSLWQFRQGDVLESASPALQNYFLYALARIDAAEDDPIAWLKRTPPVDLKSKFWENARRMWCTAPFLHAAGRRGETFSFERVSVRIEDTGRTVIVKGGPPTHVGGYIKAVIAKGGPPTHVGDSITIVPEEEGKDENKGVPIVTFHRADEAAYNREMRNALRELFADFPVKRQ
jgi:hypothetical protein